MHMAPAATSTNSSLQPPKLHASDIGSIKAFSESNGSSPIPSSYHSIVEPRDDVADELASSFPIVDFSLLTSDDPLLHADAVNQLGKACAEWGFFMLTGHGISEKLMGEVMDKSQEFHNLSVEEKKEFADKGPLAPIRHGTSFYPEAELFHFWRDYLKVITLPEFNFPHKPPGFKDVAYDYVRKIRAVARTLLQGISESLGLEPEALVESTGFDSGLQIFAVNLYPPCPQPDLALGMPPHTDHGLLTLLYQNGIGGLQVKHDGRWVNVDPLPNCFIVNTADQLEAVSNGRYKSIWHRAVLNNKDTRMSIVVANGPNLEKEIGPAPELVGREEPVMYKNIKYRDYFFKVQQMTKLDDTSRLDRVRTNPQN
ncbi:2-oxoglutarate-dependent dioxygenase 19-like [Prosopis cineraria]|uniref:2-oxoglutarate-dependent dioxygenase 19-like n=1 Tax=Prosopis cineraria TaxID=364024 RepID=UPI0024108AB6|nr:2-oxoglutarate-dependent dioxygenase 19-like [Prosopis cineraria]